MQVLKHEWTILNDCFALTRRDFPLLNSQETTKRKVKLRYHWFRYHWYRISRIELTRWFIGIHQCPWFRCLSWRKCSRNGTGKMNAKDGSKRISSSSQFGWYQPGITFSSFECSIRDVWNPDSGSYRKSKPVLLDTVSTIPNICGT